MRVYVNDSSDWIVVKEETSGHILFEGHSISPWELAKLLDAITIDGCELKHISDVDMEEGRYV